MRKNEPNIGVALVKELCPVCGKPMDGPIVMNKRLTKPQKKKVEDMNGKVIGFADHCCEECTKYKDNVVFFIGINESKSSPKSLEDMYRTGQISGVKKDAEVIDIVKDYIITWKDETKLIFMDEKVGKAIGVFK